MSKLNYYNFQDGNKTSAITNSSISYTKIPGPTETDQLKNQIFPGSRIGEQ